MIEIAFSSSFKKAFKKKIKRNKELEKLFWEKLKIFIENPFTPQLKTHKLSGELRNLWSFSLEYDLRVLFFFAEENKVVLVDIGTHEEVY